MILLSRIEYALAGLDLWYQEKKEELSVTERAIILADDNLERCAERITQFTKELMQ